jgi:UDPglucose--hexose-1-phosphate uridylyltransferase
MSEVRRDIVTDTWVIIDDESSEIPKIPAEVPETSMPCPMCEGNEAQTPPEIFSIRDNTDKNSPGWKVRVVPDIKPILRIEGEYQKSAVGVYDLVTGIGADEVIIECPQHVKHIADLGCEQIGLIIRTYRERIIDLHKDKRMRYILIYKNYGRLAGQLSITHTHTELNALPATPIRIKQKLHGAYEYYSYKERCLFCDIIRQETDMGDRLIFQTEKFSVIAPYASRFPFEILIIPKKHAFSFRLIDSEETADLAGVLKKILASMRSALGDPSYNFILNDSPNLLPRADYWKTIEYDYHWHIEITPRIYRTTGFELGTGFYINRYAPERAASVLRAYL